MTSWVASAWPAGILLAHAQVFHLLAFVLIHFSVCLCTHVTPVCT